MRLCWWHMLYLFCTHLFSLSCKMNSVLCLIIIEGSLALYISSLPLNSMKWRWALMCLRNQTRGQLCLLTLKFSVPGFSQTIKRTASRIKIKTFKGFRETHWFQQLFWADWLNWSYSLNNNSTPSITIQSPQSISHMEIYHLSQFEQKAHSRILPATCEFSL